MDIHEEIQRALVDLGWRPKGIRLSVDAFNELLAEGYISHGEGGPFGSVVWATGVPWYDGNIFAWCDPSFEGRAELPSLSGNKSRGSGDA